jgi:hypothetical protein
VTKYAFEIARLTALRCDFANIFRHIGRGHSLPSRTDCFGETP